MFDSPGGSCDKRKKELAVVCADFARGKGPASQLIIAQSYESWRQGPLKWLYQSVCKTKKFFVTFVMDESQRAKSPKGSKTLASNGALCRWIADHCDQTLLLTGTPMPHSPIDIWSQFYCVDKELFGDNFFRFRSYFFNMIEVAPGIKAPKDVKKSKLDEFKEVFDRGAYTLTLEDALDLPPLTHKNRMVILTQDEMTAYLTMEDRFFMEIRGDGDTDDAIVTAGNVLSKLGKLSQVTGGSVRLDTGEIVPMTQGVPAKAAELAAILSDEIPADDPVIVFCRYVADIRLVHSVARENGRRSFELSGRIKELGEWRGDDTGSVLVVQESAGGVGINLTRARVAIYFSVSHSLGDFDQSIARFYRKGQDFPTTAIHLIAQGTVDEDIRKSIENKRSVVKAVLDRGGIRYDEDWFDDESEDDWAENLDENFEELEEKELDMCNNL